MQDVIRSVVLDYLRAREVPFVWRRGIIEVPDTRKILALASGRDHLTLTFDQEVANIAPDVDYVTFGHPVLSAILDEVKGQKTYSERYQRRRTGGGSDSRVPHVVWQKLRPGSAVPVIERQGVATREALEVRFQVDIESDFRHIESFSLVLDLSTGNECPELIRRAETSTGPPPEGLSLKVPDRLQSTLGRAMQLASDRVKTMLDVESAGAEKRLHQELERARVGGESAARLQHLEKELSRKYDLQANLRVLGLERWIFETGRRYVVRDGSGTELGELLYDAEQDKTSYRSFLPDRWSASGSATNSLTVALCQSGHVLEASKALKPCATCRRRHCRRHLERCQLSKILVCDRDRGTCDVKSHNGPIATSQLLKVGSRTICTEHAGDCSECGQTFLKKKLEPTGIPKAGQLCRHCRTQCVDCATFVAKAHATSCDRGSGDLCPSHVVKCALSDCGKNVARSKTSQVDVGRVCRDHTVQCMPTGGQEAPDLTGLSRREAKRKARELEPHWILADKTQACAVTGAVICDKHSGTCPCGATIVATLALTCSECDSACCPVCAEDCTSCDQPVCRACRRTCELSGEVACPKHWVACELESCERKVAARQSVAVKEGQVCSDHALRCSKKLSLAGLSEKRPNLEARLPDSSSSFKHFVLTSATVECSLSGVRVCDEHHLVAACGHGVSAALGSVCSGCGEDYCLDCFVLCKECQSPVCGSCARKCELSGQLVCPSDWRSCGLKTCETRAGPSQFVNFDGRPVCGHHVSKCRQGHIVLRETLLDCSLTGQSLCPDHRTECSCGRTVVAEMTSECPRTAQIVCQACRKTCCECGAQVHASVAGECEVTGEATCDDHLETCRLETCGRRVRVGRTIELANVPWCDDHIVACPEEAEHETVTDLLTCCVGEPKSGACDALICHSEEHDCVNCGVKTCIEHRFYAQGVSVASFCRRCLARLETCGRCGCPFAEGHVSCQLCETIKGEKFDAIQVPPPDLRESIARILGTEPTRWRMAVVAHAALYEARVGTRLHHFCRIEGDSEIYHRTSGRLAGLASWVFGGS